MDDYFAQIERNGEKYHLEIRDTCEEQYPDGVYRHQRRKKIVLLAYYSSVDRESLKSLEEHIIPLRQQGKDKHPIILVGTKGDLCMDRYYDYITLKEAAVVAKRLGAAACLQCSAKYENESKSGRVEAVFEAGIAAAIAQEKAIALKSSFHDRICRCKTFWNSVWAFIGHVACTFHSLTSICCPHENHHEGADRIKAHS